jgi:hypothetical protein
MLETILYILVMGIAVNIFYKVEQNESKRREDEARRKDEADLQEP